MISSPLPQEENKTLVRIQHLKTKAIEKLSEELSLTTTRAKELASLADLCREKDERLRQIGVEMETLRTQGEKRDAVAKREEKEREEGLDYQTMKAWVDERRCDIPSLFYMHRYLIYFIHFYLFIIF